MCNGPLDVGKSSVTYGRARYNHITACLQYCAVYIYIYIYIARDVIERALYER